MKEVVKINLNCCRSKWDVLPSNVNTSQFPCPRTFKLYCLHELFVSPKQKSDSKKERSEKRK